MPGKPILQGDEKNLIEEWLDLSLEELGTRLSTSNIEQIVVLVAALQPELDYRAAEKLKVIFRSFKESHHFEKIGKVINASQLAILIPLFDHQEVERIEPLSHLFSDMLPIVFKGWLSKAGEEELVLLRKMGIFPPLQHQLTLLSHEIERELDDFHRKTVELTSGLLKLSLETISYTIFNEYLTKLIKLRQQDEHLYHLVNRALLIAWNSERTDLIEKLTLLKDGCHRMLYEYIGQPRTSTHVPTGVYEILEFHFAEVFGNANDPSDDAALKDDEPGIEALTKFGLWSLLDYYGVGLLPEFDVATWENLKNDEESFHAYEAEMHKHLNAHLDALCLNTVADFKKAHIYSLGMLRDFLLNRGGI